MEGKGRTEKGMGEGRKDGKEEGKERGDTERGKNKY